MDFITVWIIARNEEKVIGNTLWYLFDQTYSKDSFEIIIVDGNSSDKTREVSSELLEKSWIQYKVINERTIQNKFWGPNYGHSFARNVIIDHVDERSKYIAWIDADCRADDKWLESLHARIIDTSDDVAAAGGPRYVETQWLVPDNELMLNYYFTSCIMSLGNPAFCNKVVEYMPSVAGYNSIYKIEILKEYYYDTTYPFNTDDIEINYRLSKHGYKFLYSGEAKIYHRLDETVWQFLKHMIIYGKGATNVMKLHKSLPRLYIPLAFSYFLYSVLLPFLMIGSGLYFGSSLYPLFPFIGVALLAFAVFIENFKKTKKLSSLYVFLLVPAHPFMYGYGVLKGLVQKR